MLPPESKEAPQELCLLFGYKRGQIQQGSRHLEGISRYDLHHWVPRNFTGVEVL